jgi:hypothetical protein
MDIATLYIQNTCDALNAIGMTHPEAHIHAGLLIYVGMQLVLRTRRASGIALQAVFGAEMVNEILDRAFYGSWRWPDTLGDIALTMMWPTILYTAAKFRRARWTVGSRRQQQGARLIRETALALAPERTRR